MTVARGLFLIVLFGGLAVSAAVLRTEQATLAANIERLHRERIDLRRAAWASQLDISRLRSPSRIDDRVAVWSLGLRAPGSAAETVQPDYHIAAR